ncbi:STM4014 family protein [Chitinivorax sp. B]|uniref:STM4014 family protein n=1 Tax=Chitinivorax sp. B TaxID=2502235 RepID=UPI0010F478F8|nr:STM4014 family protein [Chitinivorax sp. B]
MRLVLLAHPAHPRVTSLQQVLVAQHLPPAVVVSYRDWLTDPTMLLAALQAPCWLKLEAPGEAEQMSDVLIARGAAASGQVTPPALRHGELAHSAWWFRGFADALRELEVALWQRPWVRCVNPPATILAMCDKLACQQRLQQHGIDTPLLLGAVTGFADLQAQMQQQAIRRVFVKPRYGSSASGVVALETDGRGRFAATTSVEMQTSPTPQLFNSLHIRRYRDQAVAVLIDALTPNALYAEAWVPKPRSGNQRFDIRMVTLAGQPTHRVVRLSHHPMTNLHLGNQRGSVENYLSLAAIERMEATTDLVAACFPESHVAGIDMIVTERRCHVLEVNAFGDWLPQLQWRGKTVHEAQVAALFAAVPGVIAPF